MLLFQHNLLHTIFIVLIILSQFKFSISLVPCSCGEDSCTYNWNGVLAGQGCHDSSGWPIFICGANRGMTWMGNTFFVFQRKIGYRRNQAKAFHSKQENNTS